MKTNRCASGAPKLRVHPSLWPVSCPSCEWQGRIRDLKTPNARKVAQAGVMDAILFGPLFPVCPKCGEEELESDT